MTVPKDIALLLREDDIEEITKVLERWLQPIYSYSDFGFDDDHSFNQFKDVIRISIEQLKNPGVTLNNIMPVLLILLDVERIDVPQSTLQSGPGLKKAMKQYFAALSFQVVVAALEKFVENQALPFLRNQADSLVKKYFPNEKNK